MDKTIYVKEYQKLLGWLRSERKRKSLSMRDLGRMLRVHHSWVGRVEQGERRLDLVEFLRLCGTIRCSPAAGMKFVKAIAKKRVKRPRKRRSKRRRR